MMKWTQQLSLANKPFTASLAQAVSVSSSQSPVLLTSICWGAFLAYSMVYCLLYTQHIDGAPRCIQSSLQWATTEYGLWLLFAPLQIIGLQRLYTRGWLACIAWCCALVLVVNYLRVSIDLWLKPDAVWMTSWVYFWPTQLAAAGYTVLGWALLMLAAAKQAEGDGDGQTQHPRGDQPLPCPESSQEHALSSQNSRHSYIDNDNHSASAPVFNNTLRVQTGTGECEVDVGAVDYVVAAGNYMEVVTPARTYLVRATLKQLQQQLAPHGFARSHRSYLVNLAHVAKQQDQALLLHSGQQVPVSARFRKFIEYQ